MQTKEDINKLLRELIENLKDYNQYVVDKEGIADKIKLLEDMIKENGR